MKQSVIILMFSTLVLSACSSSKFEIKESEVPQNVVAALKAKYPSAQVTKWVAEKEDGRFYFEAEIKDGDKEKEIHITSDGSSVTEED
ncbi:MAG TPA: hypothetical protein PKL37_22480 [Panacibacter sp.]|nr:hypothetical protein [Panacibacter sp.]